VTALLVSIYPGPTEEMAAALVRIAGFIRERAGGGPAIGIHLEGPYLSLAKPGALPAEHFRVYRKSELDLLLDAADGFVKTMTLAPELPGGPALIRHLLRRGVVPSFGHSDAGYDEARQAIAAGVRHATHLFNAMHGIHHRGPGPVVAFLEDDRAHVELIADGFHVQVPVLKLVHAVKARERVILVSDSVEACGLAEGPHSFAGKRVELRGGRVTLPDGTLAGSALTLDHAVALHRRELGLPAAEAVLLASGNPAALLGDRKRGEIAPGRRADLVLLDPALKVLATWLGGTQVWGKRM
jgi:N-acetylglucosamine-6-phosphate deacetylase